MTDDHLMPSAGSYRKLKTFQLAQLIFDLTVLFCDRYIDARSRTKDQMVQAARSGAQNIAEGSIASATSKKMELKLTNVARASIEELRLDYEDFLRQRKLSTLEPEHPALVRFRASRCASLDDVRQWVQEEHGCSTDPTPNGDTTLSPCEPIPSQALAANAALSLIHLCCNLLEKQLKSQAKTFEHDGGFTERLYDVRSRRRRRDT